MVINMQSKPAPDFYEDNKLGYTKPRVWVLGFLTFFFILIIAPYIVYFISNIFVRRLLIAGYVNSYDPNYFLLVVWDWLPSVILYGFGIWFVQRKLRGRPLLKVITAAKMFRWERLLAAITVFLSVTAVFLFVEALFANGTTEVFVAEEARQLLSFDYEYSGFTLKFWLGLPAVLLLSPLNSAFQEIIFRGFADQGLTKFLPSKILAFGVSSILFALYHYGNTEMYYGVVPYLLMMVIFGLSLSIITSMDGGLEAAIGIHIANNLFYFLIIGSPDAGWLPTWLFSYRLEQYTFQTILLDIVFFFLCVYLLSIWNFGLADRKRKAVNKT